MIAQINPTLSKLVVPIDQLKEDPTNVRKHDERNIAAIMASLQEFGQQKPIVALKDGTVIAGNGTLRAAIRLGWEKVAVSYFDSKDALRAKAYAVADNRTAELADWDAPALHQTLKELEIGGFGLDSTLHFKSDEIRDLLADFEKENPLPVATEEEIPDLPKKPISKLHTLWILGDHRLLCGDSTRLDDVALLLKGKKADLVYTDPPYNVAYGEKKIPGHKHRQIKNDNLDLDGWKTFNEAIIKSIKAAYKGGDIYLWGASGPEGMRQRLWLVEAGFHWSATLVWKKQQLVLSPANYQRLYEPCFYGWLKKSTYVADRKQTEVWEMDRPFRSDLHPTMKPVPLVQRALRNSSMPGDVVLDLFGGSGSTLIACELMSRKCRMMELDPAYCDVIVQRFEALTGKKARLEKAEQGSK
jgi:DNA modification methylase